MPNIKEQITRNMKSNKSKDTKPELLLRKELWRRGLRYRKNCKAVIGKPDIVFLGVQIAVFVDGKMWHGYDWERQRNDFKSNREYWISKIEQNMERDYDVTQQLIELDWAVIRFWDFEIKKDVSGCADKVEQAYRNRKRGKEQ
jgi:DNA mismatch endonuclease (patch repair protein)